MLGYDVIIFRLFLALVLGGLIGIERQRGNHDAGLKTHILVTVASAGIMLMSINIHSVYGGDISRIGAQVVSGIGFLGAGCILVNGNRIKGLTTAAGLWTASCVGLTIGMGYYLISGIIVALTLLTTILLKPLANSITKNSTTENCTIKIKTKKGFEAIAKYFDETRKIVSVSEEVEFEYIVKYINNVSNDNNEFIADLMDDKNIISVERIS